MYVFWRLRQSALVTASKGSSCWNGKTMKPSYAAQILERKRGSLESPPAGHDAEISCAWVEYNTPSEGDGLESHVRSSHIHVINKATKRSTQTEGVFFVTNDRDRFLPCRSRGRALPAGNSGRATIARREIVCVRENARLACFEKSRDVRAIGAAGMYSVNCDKTVWIHVVKGTHNEWNCAFTRYPWPSKVAQSTCKRPGLPAYVST